MEAIDKSVAEADLIAKIADVHAIGIRSKTELNATVLKAAKKLLTIGCFCIGTDQTDLESAALNGTCVFNVRARIAHKAAEGRKRTGPTQPMLLHTELMSFSACSLLCALSVCVRVCACACPGSFRQHSFGG